jgi:hypothetical protein
MNRKNARIKFRYESCAGGLMMAVIVKVDGKVGDGSDYKG